MAAVGKSVSARWPRLRGDRGSIVRRAPAGAAGCRVAKGGVGSAAPQCSATTGSAMPGMRLDPAVLGVVGHLVISSAASGPGLGRQRARRAGASGRQERRHHHGQPWAGCGSPLSLASPGNKVGVTIIEVGMARRKSGQRIVTGREATSLSRPSSRQGCGQGRQGRRDTGRRRSRPLQDGAQTSRPADLGSAWT